MGDWNGSAGGGPDSDGVAEGVGEFAQGLIPVAGALGILEGSRGVLMRGMGLPFTGSRVGVCRIGIGVPAARKVELEVRGQPVKGGLFLAELTGIPIGVVSSGGQFLERCERSDLLACLHHSAVRLVQVGEELHRTPRFRKSLRLVQHVITEQPVEAVEPLS